MDWRQRKTEPENIHRAVCEKKEKQGAEAERKRGICLDGIPFKKKKGQINF